MIKQVSDQGSFCPLVITVSNILFLLIFLHDTDCLNLDPGSSCEHQRWNHPLGSSYSCQTNVCVALANPSVDTEDQLLCGATCQCNPGPRPKSKLNLNKYDEVINKSNAIMYIVGEVVDILFISQM